MMKIAGKIAEIKESQQVSDTFRKRNFTIEYTENAQYPEYITFELVQDKCDLLDGFQLGQSVEVSFNLRGRKWTAPTGETKYFNSLQAWRLEPLAGYGSNPSGVAMPVSTPPAKDIEDDLPF
jgi:hypothetical protein